MNGVFCPEHKSMVDHLNESQKIRDTIIRNDEKIDNFEKWIPKISDKVDRIPDIMNETYLKIVLTLGGLNVGTLVIGAIIMFIFRKQ